MEFNYECNDLFSQVPIEICLHICSFLTLKDLFRFAKCSRFCYRIANSDPLYILYVKSNYSLLETYPLTFHKINLTQRLFWQYPKRLSLVGYFKIACEKKYFDTAQWILYQLQYLNDDNTSHVTNTSDVMFLITAIENNVIDTNFKKWTDDALNFLLKCDYEAETFYTNTIKKCCEIGVTKTTHIVLNRYSNFKYHQIKKFFYIACLHGNLQVVQLLYEKYPNFELLSDIEDFWINAPAIALLNSKNDALIVWAIPRLLSENIDDKLDLILKSALYHQFYDVIESIFKYYPHNRKRIEQYFLKFEYDDKIDIQLMHTIMKVCPEINNTYLFRNGTNCRSPRIESMLRNGKIDCIKLLYQTTPQYFYNFVSGAQLLMCICEYHRTHICECHGIDCMEYVEWIFSVFPKLNKSSEDLYRTQGRKSRSVSNRTQEELNKSSEDLYRTHEKLITRMTKEIPNFKRVMTEQFIGVCIKGHLQFAKWLFLNFMEYIQLHETTDVVNKMPITVQSWLVSILKYNDVTNDVTIDH